jgi:hypothetical protein
MAILPSLIHIVVNQTHASEAIQGKQEGETMQINIHQGNFVKKALSF